MGAYTPLPWAPPDLVAEVTATVLQPTVDELARRGTPFVGLLYAGLALTGRGRARGRVQRPVRRPGDPAAAGPADHAAGRGAVRRGDRQPGRPARAGVDRRRGRRRGAGRGELPGPAGDRRGDRRSGAGGRERRRGGARRHRRSTRRAGWSAAAAGCSAWSALERDVELARERAYAGIGRITLPGSFYRTDIAAPAADGSRRPERHDRQRAGQPVRLGGDAGHLARGEQDHRRAAAVAGGAHRPERSRRRPRRRRPGHGAGRVRGGGRLRSTWPASPPGSGSPGTTSRPGSRSSTPSPATSTCTRG